MTEVTQESGPGSLSDKSEGMTNQTPKKVNELVTPDDKKDVSST